MTSLIINPYTNGLLKLNSLETGVKYFTLLKKKGFSKHWKKKQHFSHWIDRGETTWQDRGVECEVGKSSACSLN